MPSILIVDDQALVRRGLRQTLADELRDAVFGEARSAEEALRIASKRPWDLITLETFLADKEEFELLQTLRRRCPAAKILVLSMRASRRLEARAVELGASAYLRKSAPLPELRRAVRKVLAGGTYIGYIGRALTGKAASPSDSDEDETPRKALSAREREILVGVSSGRSEKEIGRELSLSIKTVSTYKRRALNKLRLNSTAALIRYAMDHGLG